MISFYEGIRHGLLLISVSSSKLGIKSHGPAALLLILEIPSLNLGQEIHCHNKLPLVLYSPSFIILSFLI